MNGDDRKLHWPDDPPHSRLNGADTGSARSGDAGQRPRLRLAAGIFGLRVCPDTLWIDRKLDWSEYDADGGNLDVSAPT